MILVTGAAGYVGSMIVHMLNRTFQQPDVIGIDFATSSNLPDGFNLIRGDVGNAQTIVGVLNRHRVTKVIHCAADVSVPESVNSPFKYYFNNTMASLTLINACVMCQVENFVFSSTAAVYGNPEFPRPMREDDRTRPCSPYGWSKLMTEQMLRDVCAVTGMNGTVLRYFNVAGADPFWQTGPKASAPHLITRACQAALGLDELTIYGDGKDVRDYIHVSDVARAHLQALDLHNGFSVMNIGSGHGYTVNEVVNAVGRAVKHPSSLMKIKRAQPRVGDPRTLVADTRLITDRFGWKPQYDLNAIVEHVLAWERKESAPTP